MNKIFNLIVLLFFVVGCKNSQPIADLFQVRTPYEKYNKAIEKAGLHETPLGMAWIEAGEKAMHDSVTIQLPFMESGAFQASKPEARTYRFTAQDGQVLTIDGLSNSTNDAALFLDLFMWKNDEWKHLAHADSILKLTHEFREDIECLVRLQPGLLVNSYYTIRISLTPALINPVSGASNRSIGSFYGDGRDGGKRKHEGVDIFAKKGTPVIAPTDGLVSRVGQNNLGGNVVWMRDSKRGHSYYFAHLESQIVANGKRVKQGDTLGTVGNTGNAKNTPPHLHFGIYQRGSKDPLNFIKSIETLTDQLALDTVFQIQPLKVVSGNANFRVGPGIDYHIQNTLPKETLLHVLGKSREWLRVSLPDGVQGFIHQSLVGELNPITAVTLEDTQPLLMSFGEDAIPLMYVEKSDVVQRLAVFEDQSFIQTEDGLTGWVTQ